MSSNPGRKRAANVGKKALLRRHSTGSKEAARKHRKAKSTSRQAKTIEAFFKHTLTPLVLLDKDFNFIRVNKAYARACQRDVSEFPGHNHFEFYPSDAKEIFDKVVDTKKPFNVIARPFSFPDHPEWGVSYWDWKLTPLLDSEGEVEFLVFSLDDVTERKRAEDALRASEARLREAQRIGGIGNWEWDIQKNKSYLSDEAYHIYDLTHEKSEIAFETYISCIHPEDREVVREAARQALSEGIPFNMEFRVVHRDGTVRFVHERGELVYDGTGLPVLMKGTVQDITERRMNEKAVKAERQRLYDVLETLPVYVVLLTPEYHVPFTNRFFRERFGESHGRRSFEYLFVSLRQERRSQLNGFPWALFLRIFIYSMGSKLLRIVDMGHECILKEARSTLAHSCGRM